MEEQRDNIVIRRLTNYMCVCVRYVCDTNVKNVCMHALITLIVFSFKQYNGTIWQPREMSSNIPIVSYKY